MSRAAIRYAKAVMSVAQEKNTTDSIQKDMQQVVETIDSSNELRMVLNSPLIKNEIKLASLQQIFSSAESQTKKLFEVLIQNKRIDLLGEVAAQYGNLYNQLHKVQKATVTTAVPISAALTEKVKAKVKELTGNDATLKNVVDESIIGGFILRVGDLQYNASIAHQLTTLKRELSN